MKDINMLIGIILLVSTVTQIIVVRFIVMPRIPNPVRRDLTWKVSLFSDLLILVLAANFIFKLGWIKF